MSESGRRYDESEREQSQGLGSRIDLDGLNLDKTRNNRLDHLNSSKDNLKNRLDSADGVISKVGEKISHLGESIKESLPQTGTIGTAAVALSDGFKSSGEYLQTHHLTDMSKDVAGVIRRHPMSALWAGIGFGFILSQLMVRK